MMHNKVASAFNLVVLVAAFCTSAKAAAAKPANGGTAQVQSREPALEDHIETAHAGAPDYIEHSAAVSTPPGPPRHASLTAQQVSSAVPATSPQDVEPSNSHLKRRLVVTCAIHLVETSQISTSTTTSAGSSRQKQNPRQQSHIRVRANLATIPSAQPGIPSATQQTDQHQSSTTVVARHSYPAFAAAPQPLQLALLASLPDTKVGRGNDHGSAGAAVQQSPLLLTVHIQQQIRGRVYLWMDSQVIVPGTATASLQANMSQSSYSWTLKQRQQTTAAVAPTAAVHKKTASAAAQHLADVPISSSSTSATSNELSTDDRKQTPNLHQSCINDGASNELQQGPSVPAASICPALQQHLTDCAAASAARTAYAVANLFDRQPAHAAWIAAVLKQNNAHQHFLLNQLPQEHPAGSSRSPDRIMHSSINAISQHSCPAWLAVYDLQRLSSKTASHVTTTMATVPAAHTALQQDGSSSSSQDAMLWAAYLGPYVRYNSETHLVTASASFQQVAMGIGGLLLATVVLAAVTCRSSSKQQRPAAAAVVPTAAAVSAAATAEQGKSQPSEHVDDKAGWNHARKQSSRLSNRDQGTIDTIDFSLFGRSALDQMDQQQRLESLADNDADDDLFGYTGAAAVASIPAAAQGATAAAALARVVRRASAQAAAALRAAAGHADSNTFPKSTAVRGHNATAATAVGAAAIPNTAAKLAAGYWDSADEDAVNQLPASIQEHLQAAGRWQRDTGGRLIRGSLRAVRAASNMAAAAVAAALSGGRAAGATGQVDDRMDVGSGGRDGELLSQLLAAAPGAELALSDEDE